MRVPAAAKQRGADLRFRIGMAREVRRAARLLSSASASAQSPDEIVDAAWHLAVGGTSIRPAQVRQELVAFAQLVQSMAPARVLEIGTGNGGTLYVLAWASRDDARILSLDIRQTHPSRRRLYASFARGSQTVAVRQADSHRADTVQSVREFFAGEELDLLFIDGDHSYEGVRRDYELYAPLVRRGGVVAFHDIVEGREEAVGGVPRFWRELRGSPEASREYVASPTQGGYGIGILCA